MPLEKGLTITNPLVLYRNLVALKRIDADPAQHRLALHLQKLYFRLLDYKPEVDYSWRLEQISRAIGQAPSGRSSPPPPLPPAEDVPLNPIRNALASLRATQRDSRGEALALTKRLTSHESALQLDSPRGLLLYGEVGTGKSMMLDLLADCLPSDRKRRWHFNTFMLEIYARLEQLQRSRLLAKGTAQQDGQGGEHALLWLARDMIQTSPILFLDEFQLPDRAASKILSNLLTSFFHLGGVLLASTNRMPEELAKASGVEFAPAPAPSSGIGLFRTDRWRLLGTGNRKNRDYDMSNGRSDFAAFLEVLRGRCDVWDMEGERDWRRREAEGVKELDVMKPDVHAGQAFEDVGSSGFQQSQLSHGINELEGQSSNDNEKILKPKYYFISSSAATHSAALETEREWATAVLRCVSLPKDSPSILSSVPWERTTLRVYGRDVAVSHHYAGVTMWTFPALCASNLGPADYISLASAFHTLILTEVPVLSLLQKNEARRFITLLDAIYEAKCKLLIRADAGPDDIFFPESQPSASDSTADGNRDGTYAETFSEIYQDQTSPFRPNISTYTSSASTPSYDTPPLPSIRNSHSTANPSLRSILADEDSDFGPVYGAGRSSSPSMNLEEPRSSYYSTRGLSDGAPGAGNEIGNSPDFQRTGTFTGEDERFAYKRARSRLWEMCGKKWWDREGEGWWKPVSRDVRRWEMSAVTPSGEGNSLLNSEMKVGMNEEMFRHGASPFRTSSDPPPKISWVHAWGMMKWGEKAGAWGKGVEGLYERERRKTKDSIDSATKERSKNDEDDR